jgi:hypothetical protein
LSPVSAACRYRATTAAVAFDMVGSLTGRCWYPTDAGVSGWWRVKEPAKI